MIARRDGLIMTLTLPHVCCRSLVHSLIKKNVRFLALLFFQSNCSICAACWWWWELFALLTIGTWRCSWATTFTRLIVHYSPWDCFVGRGGVRRETCCATFLIIFFVRFLLDFCYLFCLWYATCYRSAAGQWVVMHLVQRQWPGGGGAAGNE